MCKALEQIKQWAFEEGFAKGFAKGFEKGFTKEFMKGFEQGFAKEAQQGKQDGIQATVSILKGLRLDTELIQEKLMAAYSLTADEVQKYIQG